MEPVSYTHLPKTVKKGAEVKIKVSSGAQKITIPDFSNQEATQVYAELKNMGLEYTESRMNHPSIASGYVIKTEPTKGLSLIHIYFSQPAQKLHDRIRGVSPWPSAYSYLDGKRIKVHKSALLPDLSGESGVIQEGKRLIVGCGEGSLELLEVQPEGGKRMSGQDFLRGRRPGTEKKFTSCPSE